MGALDRIDKKEIRDLLGKGWLTHDGMWFYHTYQEVGIEKANKLNKAAIRSLAPIEMTRVKKVLMIDGKKIAAFEDLKDLILEALGIPFNINPKISKCMMHEKGECSGNIRVMLND
jgi:hypothetical protein